MNAWKPFHNGYQQEGNIFICDNGCDFQVIRGATQTVLLNRLGKSSGYRICGKTRKIR